MDPTTKAATNRAIRNIQTELEFLHDHDLLTDSQLSTIEQLLPKTSSNSAPLRSTISPPPLQAHREKEASVAPPVEHFGSVSLNEKQYPQYSPPQNAYQQTPSPAPPAYNQPPMPPPGVQAPPLASALCLYTYSPTDAGDLHLEPNDRVSILEYMNADWAKGRNERTGMEGIFPRSYVRIEEKGMMPQPPPPGASYGNMPLQIANESGPPGPPGNSKINENGKKFGKKLGNAAIFGAGATLGGNLVNSIF